MFRNDEYKKQNIRVIPDVHTATSEDLFSNYRQQDGKDSDNEDTKYNRDA